MTEFLTIRGTVRGVGYEAALKPAEWPVVTGREREWHVTTSELPIFTIAATQTLANPLPARTVIELELERRLTR